MTKYVLITCTGRAGEPHKSTRIALLQTIDAGDGVEEWDELETSSHAYRLAHEQMMQDNPKELGAMDPHPGSPRQRITVHMTGDGVPIPEDLESLPGKPGNIAAALKFWSDRHAYTKYEAECGLCGLNLSQRAEKLGPKLSAATPRDGMVNVLLRDIV